MDLVKKLSLLFTVTVLIWTADFLTRVQCNGTIIIAKNKIVVIIMVLLLEVDECCYSYASVPRNDTFCVPEGDQVDLHCVIINPHDNFANLTVTWFRSTTEDT